VPRLADLAARRPLVPLGAAVALVAALVALAASAPDELAADPGGVAGGQDLVVAARGPSSTPAPVERVAIATILSGLRAEPAVASAQVRGARRRVAILDVRLAASDRAARERATERIAAGIDPGPLTLAFGGTPRVALDGRHSLAGQLWRLEALALPVAVLIAVWLIGPGAALGAAIAAAGAIAAALVALRVAAGVAGASLVGVAPAALVGLALAIELAGLLGKRFRGERRNSRPGDALLRAVRPSAFPFLAAALAAALVPFALLVTPFPASGSVIVATAAAALAAVVLGALAVPGAIVLEDRLLPTPGGGGGGGERAREARVPLARSRLALGLLAALAIVVPLALSLGALDVRTRPLAAADLPRGSPALVAARDEAVLASADRAAHPAPAAASGELIAELPGAAAIVAGGLALALLALAGSRRTSIRSARALAVIPVALLPAAAGLGAAALLFADGHLAGAFGFARQGALEEGAVGSAIVAVVAIGSARGIRDWLTADEVDGSGSGLGWDVPALLMPAIATASVVGAGAAGVLAGADLYAAREFGVIVAVGLLWDLALRAPLQALLARGPARRASARIGSRTWRANPRSASSPTASAS
jgi:hypothetical protein